MATNPFEDNDAAYYVLLNDEGQYSLWPQFVDVPSGWQIAHNLDSRPNCMNWIETTWTDMRPSSLIAAMQRPSV